MAQESTAGSILNPNSCKVKFELSREPIDTGNCEKFEKWLSKMLSADYYLAHGFSQNHLLEEQLQSFFDLDVYQSELSKYSIKSDIYTAYSADRLFVRAKFYERFCDNVYSKRDYLDVKNGVEYCDHLYDIIQSNTKYPLFRTETEAFYLELEVARWDKCENAWDKHPDQIRDLILEFVQIVFSDQNLSEDSLSILKIVHL